MTAYRVELNDDMSIAESDISEVESAQPETSVEPAQAERPAAEVARPSIWLVAAFALTIFLGAFLLFQVQPLISKAILPWFGGTPNVWTTSMLFFQTLLFAGYAYAHLTTEKLSRKMQGIVHCIFAVAAIIALPILPAAEWKPDGASDPTIGILLLLTAHVGLPYFVLAATSPLIQVWWDRTAAAGSPYRLYSLSNAGSLLALLSYPFLVEPLLPTSMQGIGWSIAFAGFAALVVMCGGVYWWSRRSSHVLVIDAKNDGLGSISKPSASATDGENHGNRSLPQDTSISLVNRLLWIGLAATGSILLLATTNHICHDVAVVPLLWIAPLSIYLLTFILCFSGHGYPRRLFIVAMMLSTGYIVLDKTGGVGWLNERLGLGLTSVTGVPDNYMAALAVFLLAMFSCCMVCHGELWRLKPAPARLTSFYLHVSFGGAVGGILVGIGAPLLLNEYHEMSIGIILCWFLALAVVFIDRTSALYNGRPTWAWSILGALFCGLVGGLVGDALDHSPGRVARSRNFYGVLTVNAHETKNIDDYHLTMVNGLILHGLQYLEDDRRHKPTTYYTDVSGVGLAMRYTADRPNRHVAVVGLGTGTLAVHAKAGDLIRFYEIDPDVVDFAKRFFTYLDDTEADCEVVLGDARISLERELETSGSHRFDVLILDAFSSDAIPAHLLTREAMGTYLGHLVDDPGRQGILAVHISNRYLNLLPITRALARSLDLDLASISTSADEDTDAYAATWILMSRRGGLQQIVEGEDYVDLKADDGSKKLPLWTDDYTNILGVLDFD